MTSLQKEELVGVLENELLKLFPQPDKSFFYENLQQLLFKFIYNPPTNTAGSGTAPAEFLLNIQSTKNATPGSGKDGEIQAQAIGGSGNYTYTLKKTVSSPPTAGWKDPIPNNTGLFTALPPGLYTITVNDGTTTEILPDPKQVVISGNSFAVTITAKPPAPSVPGGNDVVLTAATTPTTVTGTKSFIWTNLNTGLQILSSKVATVSGIAAGSYGVQVINTPATGKPKSTAYSNITIKNPIPKNGTKGHGSKGPSITNRGVKYYLEQLKNLGKPISTDDVSSLESNIQSIIKIGIASTFNQMAEYGSQGFLISSTYDCQIISRISDYTTALLNELNTDYDKLIPKANKQALLAAQKTTSAAVAIERFSIELPEIKRAFQDEFNSDQVDSAGASLGTSYDQIKNYVESTSSNPTTLSSLDGIANALYSGSSSHISLVQEAELQGVTLAAKAAGLNTSLSNLLTTEQADALKALSNLKLMAESNLNNAVDAYGKDSKSYFKNMETYIKSKQDWEYDQLKQNAVQSALSTLNSVVMTGISKSGNFTNNPYYKKHSSN